MIDYPQEGVTWKLKTAIITIKKPFMTCQSEMEVFGLTIDVLHIHQEKEQSQASRDAGTASMQIFI